MPARKTPLRARAATPKKKARYPRGQNPQALKNKATTLHSLVCRERDRHRCRRCGGPANQVMHIVSRGYSATRTKPLNGLAGCPKCHLFLTRHPYEAAAFYESCIGVWAYAQLRELAYEGGKFGAPYWAEEVRVLTGMLEVLRRGSEEG
jgi:hypothetical protein